MIDVMGDGVMDGLIVMSRKECGVGERVKCRLACLREIGRRAPLKAWEKAAVEDTSTALDITAY